MENISDVKKILFNLNLMTAACLRKIVIKETKCYECEEIQLSAKKLKKNNIGCP